MSLGIFATAYAGETVTDTDTTGTETETETETATTKTITLTGGKAGHTYNLYQIFTGNTSDTENELTDIQWGSSANDTFKAAFATAAAAADSYENGDARSIAQGWISSSYLGSIADTKTLAADGDIAFTGLAEGYPSYLHTLITPPPIPHRLHSHRIKHQKIVLELEEYDLDQSINAHKHHYQKVFTSVEPSAVLSAPTVPSSNLSSPACSGSAGMRPQPERKSRILAISPVSISSPNSTITACTGTGI